MTVNASTIDIDKIGNNLSQYQTSTISDYIALLKPRVMSLVVFTGATGILLAPGHIHPLMAIIAVCAIALGSGAAGAINMWYDHDIDLIMERTKSRPLPQGKISPDDALQYGILLAVFSVFILATTVNIVSSILLACAILFYVFIYTIWLKRRSPQNIVIGGAAGSIPPMIGWAAVTNSVSLESFILFLLIFFWTPPHFWALSLYKMEDYKKANIPMMPVVYGLVTTKKYIIAYSVILAFVAILPAILGFAGMIYLVSAILLSGLFIYLAIKTFYDQGFGYARKTFGYSILYLFLLFAILVIDKYFLISII